MSEEEKIRQLLYKFESSGLVEKNVDQILSCFSTRILGIGIGEQGFVTSLEDVKHVFLSGLKAEGASAHTLTFGRVEILQLDKRFAVVCAEVQVNFRRPEDDKAMKSQFQQSLTVIREEGEWKICGLHASSPTVTEEDIEAYPLKFAEKTLASLREKIGEEVYLAEDQYRKAVLADTIAFYIINFTTDRFEKCQLHNDSCVYVDSGTPYEDFITEKIDHHVFEEDRAAFLQSMSLKSMIKAFQESRNEVSCEYRMRLPDDSFIWTRTIIRLIQDVATGDKKGIMYVKNINEEKQAALKIQKKADYDAMTNTLNRSTMCHEVNYLMQQSACPAGGIFLMTDTDDFKLVNDTFGHPVGDQVLIAIAEILRKAFDPPARIARLGGDEFGVFLPGRTMDKAMEECVDELLHTVRRFQLPEMPQVKFSLSIGGVYLSMGNFEDFYHAADKALYQVKRAGKNNFFLIDGTKESALENRSI